MLQPLDLEACCSVLQQLPLSEERSASTPLVVRSRSQSRRVVAPDCRRHARPRSHPLPEPSSAAPELQSLGPRLQIQMRMQQPLGAAAAVSHSPI